MHTIRNDYNRRRCWMGRFAEKTREARLSSFGHDIHVRRKDNWYNGSRMLSIELQGKRILGIRFMDAVR